MSRHIITINNIKGGVGKTTLSVNLAFTLSELLNKKTLLIDLDPQMNATEFFYTDEHLIEKILANSQITICKLFNPYMRHNDDHEIIFEFNNNLHIIPSHLNLVPSISNQNDIPILKNFLDKDIIKEKKYDFIIIDTPPTWQDLTRMALLASDGYLIPTTCSKLSLFGIDILINKIKQMEEREKNMNIQLYGIVITKTPAYNPIKLKRTITTLTAKYPNDLFNKKIREEYAADSMVFSDKPNERFFLSCKLNSKESNRLKEDITAFTNEFYNRINKNFSG